MNDTEFQSYLNAATPISFKFGLFQTLILDNEGFTVKALITRRYQWKNVSGFKVRQPRGSRGIILLLFNDTNGGILSIIHRFFSGYHAAITTGFETGSSFEKLGQLMNYRSKKLRENYEL